jgi:hypothetical protein
MKKKDVRKDLQNPEVNAVNLRVMVALSLLVITHYLNRTLTMGLISEIEL